MNGCTISKDDLEQKIRFFVDVTTEVRHSDESRARPNETTCTIKWTRNSQADLFRGVQNQFDEPSRDCAPYRPFVKMFYYSDELVDGMTSNQPNLRQRLRRQSRGLLHQIQARRTIHGPCKPAIGICTSLAIPNAFPSIATPPPVSASTTSPIGRWRSSRQRYPDHASRITKPDIFHYVYAVLHHPAYREKYERNLKREFPRIPFYDDFRQWAEWGRAVDGAAPGL